MRPAASLPPTPGTSAAGYRSQIGSISHHRCDRRHRDRGTFAGAPVLGFVHHGIGEIRIGPESVRADPNQVLLSRGGIFRVRHHGCAGPPCATTVALARWGVRGLYRQVGVSASQLHRLFSHRTTIRGPRIQQAIQLLILESRPYGERGSREVDRRISLLFQEVIASALPRRSPGRHCREPVEKTRFTLVLRAGDPPSLEELAAEAGCTRFHLCRIFKEDLGMTIREYLHRVRLHRALGAILAGQEDLTGLALRLGYSSHSHFTSRFRRYYGSTPSAFRRRAERSG